jgi:demethylmenaquinone methyltransferase/2-methoxy-6-polyprenyl-1,4-benzoquinol methylase
MQTVTPYNDNNKGKKEQVAEMFNNIAPKYDFLNHFLSMGIDVLWRKKAIKLLRQSQPKQLLDIATGTGDFAIEALSLNPDKVIGVDISEGMLGMGKIKIEKKGLQSKIELLLGDSEKLPFQDNTFDAITVGFGVRNFENLEKGLTDMHRVLKSGGTALVLEFSKPKAFPIKQLYNFYFSAILPLLGKMLSKDSSAYTYLPESVKAFPDGEDFLAIYRKVGFIDVKQIPLSFGIASIYIGKK